MLKDWLWSIVITAGILIELGGWSVCLRRFLFTRYPLRPTLAWAMSVAIAAQVYFTMSLFTNAGHVPFLVAGILALVVSLRPKGERPRLHLTLARFFSPLSWKRAWPWLILPVSWFFLRLTDGLLPSSRAAPLAIHLTAPHHWFEQGRQILDPLFPTGAAASIWEGLYFHAIALTHASTILHRAALVRGQIVSQLLHFLLGQVLTLVILADLITPLVKSGWDALVQSMPTPQRRHQLGMASVVAVPSSAFFAWLACAQPAVDWSGTVAQHNWGTALFVFASLSTLFFAFTAQFQSRVALAGFFAGTACAIDSSALLCIPGFLAAALIIQTIAPTRAPRAALAWLLGFLIALGPWIYRNVTQADVWIYPLPFAWRSPVDHHPGWLPENWASLVGEAYVGGDWGGSIRALLVFGAIGFTIYVWRRAWRALQWRLLGLVAFTLVTALCARVVRAPNGWVPFVPVSVVLCAVLGIESLFLARSAYVARFGRWIPLAWLVTGLVIVQLPWHVLWQNFGLALTPTTTYLESAHSHFAAKQWASLHLPSNTRIVWTSDDRFYYSEPFAAAIPSSRLLGDTLLKNTSSLERAKTLCELGFNVLAWEDYHHGPETTGLSTFLRLNEGAVLHSSEDVTLLNLMPVCK